MREGGGGGNNCRHKNKNKNGQNICCHALRKQVLQNSHCYQLNLNLTENLTEVERMTFCLSNDPGKVDSNLFCYAATVLSPHMNILIFTQRMHKPT